jgi:phosphonate transport system substrate-binding protein
MINRRSLGALAPTLLMGASALAPQLARAQTAPAPVMRRSLDGNIAMPATGRKAWAAQVPTLRIGLLGGENESDRLGRFGPYQALLQETFQVPVRLFPASDYAGVLQAFSAKQIEMSSLGASGYAGAWLDTNGGIEPLVVPEENDGSIAYKSVLIVRTDSGIMNLEQMRGKSLAWADPNSTSGYLIPRFALRRQGIGVENGQYFSRTGFGGGHEQAVVAVLQRQYDGAVTWVSGQGDPAQGYSRGNLRAMVEKGMLKMADIRILWMSDPIPNGPLAARTDLPASFKEDMKLFHLALPKTHPQIYEQVERGGGLGYREATHDLFQIIVDLRREEASERRRRS